MEDASGGEGTDGEVRENDKDGATCPLASSPDSSPVLLLLLGSSGSTGDTTLRSLAPWPSRLPCLFKARSSRLLSSPLSFCSEAHTITSRSPLESSNTSSFVLHNPTCSYNPTPTHSAPSPPPLDVTEPTGG